MNLSTVEEVLEHGAMSLSGLIRKASNLLGLGGEATRYNPPPLDGEIIYCKNNVCVHPPNNVNKLAGDHYPGYLNIRSQDDEILGSTLILTWIPNSTLKKNPRSIENSPAATRITPRRSPRQEYSRADYLSSCAESPGVLENSESSVIVGNQLNEVSDEFTSEANKQVVIDAKEVSEDAVNNIRYTPALRSDCNPRIGTNVNLIFEKRTNVEVNSVSRSSGASVEGEVQRFIGDLSSTVELTASALAVNRSPSKTSARQLRENALRRSGSSNRSVASVEMDGDNLVVVTEEVFENETFSGDVECVPLCSPKDHLRQTLDKIAAAASKPAAVANPSSTTRLRESLDLRLNINPGADGTEDKVSDFDFEIPIACRSSGGVRNSSSSSTSGPDTASPGSPVISQKGNLASGESIQSTCSDDHFTDTKYCISFPENSVTYCSSPSDSLDESNNTKSAEQVCGVFSVDLGQMRSLRIFYNDDACTSGQLVIASRESQYKILHFHHGGLDRLVETLSDWKFLAQPKRRVGDGDLHCHQFSVIRPYLTSSQCHPEEGIYEKVNEDTWHRHMNDRGQIEDDFHLRKAIFFAGLHPTLRQEVWPFLLHYFPYSSTFEDREQLRNDRFIEYQNTRKSRESMAENEKMAFWKTVQCTVEKDVVRTDRCHPYFSGDGNPNVDVLKNILLNYAVAHPNNGYSQGMSDLLAPVLAEVQNEVDAYWCFVGLMQKTTFFSSPTDIDMDSQLLYLKELLRILLPHFYRHLQKLSDGLELLFCHRWLILCFKREFHESDALHLWEVCWSRFQTDFFHLFVCVAVIAVYGEDVVEQDLPADEMLLHFSSLSMHMSGDVVLRKARGLLHQFRTLRRIPCTLDGLCVQCGPGMWDSGHVPVVECVGQHPDGVCKAVVDSRARLSSKD